MYIDKANNHSLVHACVNAAVILFERPDLFAALAGMLLILIRLRAYVCFGSAILIDR